jgi:hypothetical protein
MTFDLSADCGVAAGAAAKAGVLVGFESELAETAG